MLNQMLLKLKNKTHNNFLSFFQVAVLVFATLLNSSAYAMDHRDRAELNHPHNHGLMQKTVQWVKEHPKESVYIAQASITLILAYCYLYTTRGSANCWFYTDCSNIEKLKSTNLICDDITFGAQQFASKLLSLGQQSNAVDFDNANKFNVLACWAMNTTTMLLCHVLLPYR